MMPGLRGTRASGLAMITRRRHPTCRASSLGVLVLLAPLASGWRPPGSAPKRRPFPARRGLHSDHFGAGGQRPPVRLRGLRPHRAVPTPCRGRPVLRSAAAPAHHYHERGPSPRLASAGQRHRHVPRTWRGVRHAPTPVTERELGPGQMPRSPVPPSQVLRSDSEWLIGSVGTGVTALAHARVLKRRSSGGQ